jgi:REP element-mobilizing transposase RayT
MEDKTKEQYQTWGRSRSNRLSNYDYSEDRPVHVTICTDNKKHIVNSEARAKVVIEELSKTAKELRFRNLCYCLMPDHLHIVLSPGGSSFPLSRFLNILKGRTTAVFREKEGLNKTWQRSVFYHVIRTDEDLVAIIEYIRNNPVRKGISEKADDYPYSECFDGEIRKYI